MADMNVVALSGRLGKDPELKYLPSGVGVCNVSIAVDCGWGDKKSTAWLDCVFWDKKAECLAEYFRKGNRIGISGRLQQETWKTKEGENRHKIVIVVNELIFLEKKADRGEEPQGQSPEPQSQDIPEEEVPF